MKLRNATIQRKTRETEIELTLNLDGTRQIEVSTGLGFFDHMLSALAFHAGWDLSIRCEGDLYVDDHHTVEDCGLTLGLAISESLGNKGGIERFASNFAPLDESLARCVVDVSGRAHSVVNLDLKRDRLGNVACENLTHFFHSMVANAKITLHLDVIRGENDHHKAEAAFKACALAFKTALTVCVDSTVRSTKGVL